MSAVQTIRAKSGASPQTARVTTPDDEDSEKAAAEEPVEDAAPEHAPPPPGLGKLVDRTV